MYTHWHACVKSSKNKPKLITLAGKIHAWSLRIQPVALKQCRKVWHLSALTWRSTLLCTCSVSPLTHTAMEGSDNFDGNSAMTSEVGALCSSCSGSF